MMGREILSGCAVRSAIQEAELVLDFVPDQHHTIADMANVGYALMKAIKLHKPAYCWNESPAEIVGDLCEELSAAATDKDKSRFFIEHGVIHDRDTGRHLTMDSETDYPQQLLNVLRFFESRAAELSGVVAIGKLAVEKLQTENKRLSRELSSNSDGDQARSAELYGEIAELQAELAKLKAEHKQYVEWAEPQITLPINDHTLNRLNAVTAERDQLKAWKASVMQEVGEPPTDEKYRYLDCYRVAVIEHYKQSAINFAVRLKEAQADANRYRWIRGIYSPSASRSHKSGVRYNDLLWETPYVNSLCDPVALDVWVDSHGQPQPDADEQVSMQVGNFLRSDNDPFICKHCGQPHSAHFHTDEASRCPEMKPLASEQS